VTQSIGDLLRLIAANGLPPFLVILAAVLAPASVLAQSPAEIRSRAQKLESEWRQLRAGGQASQAAERALAGQLGALALAFVAESDRAAQAGAEQRQRPALRPAFEAIHAPLNGIYTARSQRVEQMAREVMDADGDLDALYETREWQEAQAVAAQALYYLNWLNYYGARLYDPPRSKELLEAAERGFSQFATGDRQTALIAESLLGRGLCHAELGHYEWAERDFRLVIEHREASPERKAKARVALLDTYARSGNVKRTLQYSRELLDGAGLDRRDVAAVSFYRLQALFKAAKTAAPREAEAYRREAGTLMEQLRRAGGGWSEKVEALLLTQDDPAQWAGKVESPSAKWELAKLLLQKGDEKAARPLLESIAESGQAGAKPFQPEAHYWLGVAAFKAGEHAAAARHFASALPGLKGDLAADAAYWRFKSLEALVAQEPDEQLEQEYLAALQLLLRDHPQHKLAYEARYRLGEYQQAKQQFEEALATYAEVSGEPGFELRARFGTIQCAFELLQQQADPAARASLLERLGRDFDRFDESVKAYEASAARTEAPVKELQAKATILRAVHVALGGPDGDARVADLLAGFAQKFPEQEDLLAQAVRLRLEALTGAGRLTEASREVAAHAEVLRAEGRADALEKLAAGYTRVAMRRQADGDAAGATAANQVALRLYELVASLDGGGTEKNKLAMARLYETTDPDRAEALYRELRQGSRGAAFTALRGLARVSEARDRLPEAQSYWKEYTAATTPGDAPWYDGQYQQARLALALGDKKGSCKMLKDLRPAMPGLGDATLRQQLSELYEKACR
jgi:TolA-binding protein